MDAIQSAIRDFDGTVGLAARNLVTGEEIVVNGDMRFPTASAIKTAVMLEAWHQAAEGATSMDEALTLRESDKVGGSGVLGGLSEGLSLKVRDLIHRLEDDGRQLARTRGSHRQFKHPSKAGVVTVAGRPGIEVPIGTLKQILRQAQLEEDS